LSLAWSINTKVVVALLSSVVVASAVIVAFTFVGVVVVEIKRNKQVFTISVCSRRARLHFAWMLVAKPWLLLTFVL
jgi:hypothetical protein